MLKRIGEFFSAPSSSLSQHHHLGDLPPSSDSYINGKVEEGVEEESEEEQDEEEEETVTLSLLLQLDDDEDEEEEEEEDDHEDIENIPATNETNTDLMREMVERKQSEPLSFSLDITQVLYDRMQNFDYEKKSQYNEDDDDSDEQTRQDKKRDYSSENSTSLETPAERNMRLVLSRLPDEWQRFYDIQSRFLHIWQEMTEQDIAYLSENYKRHCKHKEVVVLSTEIAMSLFIVAVSECPKWIQIPMVDTRFKFDSTKNIATARIVDIMENKFLLQNIDNLWMVSMALVDGMCNFPDTFQISTSFYPDLWLTCEPYLKSSFHRYSNDQQQQDENTTGAVVLHMEHPDSHPYSIRIFNNGIIVPRISIQQKHEFKRNIVWGMYVLGHDVSYYRLLALRVSSAFVLWQRTISTCVMLQSLLESPDYIPVSIHNIVRMAMETCSFDFFKIGSSDFESLMDFVKPLLEISSVSSLQINIRRFDEGNLDTIKTDAPDVKLTFAMEFRAFREPPPQVVELVSATTTTTIPSLGGGDGINKHIITPRQPIHYHLTDEEDELKTDSRLNYLGNIIDTVSHSVNDVITSTKKENKKD